MKKITISDFSGGIQESVSPDDFTNRQWSQLKGLVPLNATTFQSQWAAQSIGTSHANGYATGFNAVFPLESENGTFLVGIKLDGTIWWCHVPAVTATHTEARATEWLQITQAENHGLSADASYATIPVTANQDFRFLTGFDFEVYKYIKQPLTGRDSDFSQDIFYDGEFNEKPKANVPAVIIGCRRRLTTYVGGSLFSMPGIDPKDQQMLVAYVDPRLATEAGGGLIEGFSGSVKVVSFPHFRRWPTYTRNFSATEVNGTPIANWPEITVDSVVYGQEERAYPIVPFSSTTALPLGSDKTFLQDYPHVGTPSSLPNPSTQMQPYTYLDINSALLPGRGIMPRGNIGGVWDGRLIIGDIEYRSDKAFEAKTSDKKAKPGSNHAIVGEPALTDENTDAHAGSIFYTIRDIDECDPRNVIHISGSGVRVAGMYQVDNYLVFVTTHGGPSDGVITLSGNLGSLISYSGVSNPQSMRRQVVRGGLGVAESDQTGHINQTCFWPEINAVAFVDNSGSVYATTGRSVDRLDITGPRKPNTSTFRDHAAAVEEHLVVWRDSRLLVFSIVESNGQQAGGCWTEIVPPDAANINEPSDLRSMVGSGSQLFMVVNGIVWRYSLQCLEAERGRINNVPISVIVSTPTIGNNTGHNRTAWQRVGVSFYTPTSCSIDEVYVRGEAMLLNTATAPTPNANPVPSYTISTDRTYTNGHYELVCPAGIGSQTVMSARFTFTGNITIKGVSVWMTGGTEERGEKP